MSLTRDEIRPDTPAAASPTENEVLRTLALLGGPTEGKVPPEAGATILGTGAPRRSRRWLGWLVLVLFVAAVVGGAGAVIWSQLDDGGNAHPVKPHARPKIAEAQIDPLKLLTVDPAELENVSATDAPAVNAAIPMSTAPNPPARALVVPMADAASYVRAVNCLTEAIYYEAAAEPETGQRAVAQVVLNRTRHAAYPGTICGVVFQGAERRTGCQFSFTCDGSLARVPSTTGWARARTIAVQAMNGTVASSVGLATHYHADYVVPVWAHQLGKVAVIGRHIFYRWNGSFGGAGAFAKSYLGNEPVIDLAALRASAALATLNQGDALPDAGLAIPPSARPVLDNQGKALGATPGTVIQAGAGTPATLPAGNRWIIGMDPLAGNAQAPAKP